MLPDWLQGTWLLALDWAIRLAALLWIPARTTPGAARSWLLLIGFVPVVGLPLYLLFGHPWLSRVRVERQATASQVIREQQLPLHALRWTPQADTSSAEVVPLIERQGDFMPTLGNAVDLLDDYTQSLQALITAIDMAEKRVHLLYYLMFDDAVGDAVVAALLRAGARGVRCRVLLDAVGAKRGLRHYRKQLQAGGVDVLAVLPGGLRWRRSGRMDLRNHRKIAVIDNQVGFVGSQNLAEAGFIDGVPNRELVARVRGPVVNHLEAVFASDWFTETGQRLDVWPDAPVCEANIATQLLPSGPAYPFENARDAINAVIHLARRKVVLVTPYFVPDEALLSALRIAAVSGVDVQLILSESNNQILAAWAQEAYFEEPAALRGQDRAVSPALPACQAPEHGRGHRAGRLDQPGHPLVRAQCRDRHALLRPGRGAAAACDRAGLPGQRTSAGAWSSGARARPGAAVARALRGWPMR